MGDRVQVFGRTISFAICIVLGESAESFERLIVERATDTEIGKSGAEILSPLHTSALRKEIA